jgi:hypothetical protein
LHAQYDVQQVPFCTFVCTVWLPTHFTCGTKDSPPETGGRQVGMLL